MRLPDGTLRHLQAVADLPDLLDTRYELIAPIGQGGMGAVYRVRDRELDREVALKVLTGVPDAADAARLINEARVLARLEHPGIVPVHDVGLLPDGRPFYVMKLVRGQRLDGLVDRLPLPERLRLLVRVTDAVAFAHAHGVVHRDLSPGNVMAGAFGEVLVMDWGVARVRRARDAAVAARQPAENLQASEASTTQHGVVLGTPGFMSPEQASGDGDRVDERSDVYSLGALLYWLIAAERGGPARCPRPLGAIAAKAAAAEPDDRYPSAEAFAADLARYLDGDCVSAHRESAGEQIARFVRRYRVAILLVAGYLIMRIALLLARGL